MTTTTDLSRDTLLRLWRTMATIRSFEERVAREFKTGQVPGFVHMYIGQEGVAAGVCANLTDADYITSTHRGHGHAVAKGCDLGAMMAEIYGRETGLCKGRGGSMHVADFSRGMVGANAIVGGGIALATGAALSAQVRGTDQVAVSFFGDGAANQGVFHESLNLASIWKLPVVYVCENNGLAESTPADYATSVDDVSVRAASYDIAGVTVDSGDVLEVYEAARRAVERARAGDGPTAARGEDLPDSRPLRGRPRALPRRPRAPSDGGARSRSGLPAPATRGRHRRGVRARRDTGRDRRGDRRGGRVREGEPVAGSGRGRAVRLRGAPGKLSERKLSMVNAIGEAMRQAMEADPSVIVMGEDVVGGAGRGEGKENAMGGTFGATRSLYPLFGPNRVRDTPISEAGFVGAGVGAAATGLRPVLDVMWADFTALAFDQIYSQASKMPYMFGGQVKIPLTIRVAMGSGLSAAAQHSGTLYSLYTHIPGLKTVVPSTPYDAKGLLLEAIFDDSPVIVFEHLRLYVSEGPVPEEPYRVAPGKAVVRRNGEDVTIVGVSYMVNRALEAAAQLAERGRSTPR